MKKHKLFIKHWMEFKPYKKQGKVELYYLKVANKIYSNLDWYTRLTTEEVLFEEELAMLCCFLTCYFEDVISKTNVWNTFRQEHQKLYGKKLPFYEISPDYLDDEINLEDIKFLIWYFASTIQDTQFLNPDNAFIDDIANSAFEVFDREFEYAPENDQLQPFLKFDVKDADFYETRAFIQQVFFDTYLFYPDTKVRLKYDIETLFEDHPETDPDTAMAEIRHLTELYTFNIHNALLGYSASHWASKFLGAAHAAHKGITGISKKINSYFFFDHHTQDEVFLEHIASGMSFKMTKESFDHASELEKGDIIFIGLVKWRDQWWFSGNYLKNKFDADLILDLKNSEKERAEVQFLYDQAEIATILKKQEEAFLAYNNGSQIAFVDGKDIPTFLSDYFEFYNESLGISEEDRNEAAQKQKNEGYLKNPEDKEHRSENLDEPLIVFFNPSHGIELINDVFGAFPDKNNPYFEKETKEDFLHMVCSTDISKEFVDYCVETYKNDLSFFKTAPYANYLEDLDFLMRFYKRQHYFTRPGVILTGLADKKMQQQ